MLGKAIYLKIIWKCCHQQKRTSVFFRITCGRDRRQQPRWSSATSYQQRQWGREAERETLLAAFLFRHPMLQQICKAQSPVWFSDMFRPEGLCISFSLELWFLKANPMYISPSFFFSNGKYPWKITSDAHNKRMLMFTTHSMDTQSSDCI